MGKRYWTPAQDELLRAHYRNLGIRELCALLGWPARSIYNRAKRLGLFKEVARWTEAQDELLRAHYPNRDSHALRELIGRSDKSIYDRAVHLGLRKSQAYLDERAREAAKRLRLVGFERRFVKGQPPWNKGATGCPPDTFVAHQFRKGSISPNTRPLGATAISNGYLIRKVVMAHGDGLRRHQRWRPAHRLLWEEQRGPIPPGHICIFLDGDPTHLAIENLACVSRAVRAWLNKHGYANQPAPITRAAIALAELALATKRLNPNSMRRHKEGAAAQEHP